MAKFCVASALWLSTLLYSHASDDFLGTSEPSAQLLEELEIILGRGIGARFGQLKAQIHPMFLALPKRSGNVLSPATARYALHRINMDLHGWSINGIQPDKDAFNTAKITVSDILSGLLPGHILTIFERHIALRAGISLDDVSMMASTIEHFVHEDQKGILQSVCEALNISTVGVMHDDDLRNIIKTYLTIFLDSITIKDVNRWQSFKRFFARTEDMYPGWPDATMLVDDEVDTTAYFEKDNSNPFRAREGSMDVAHRVLERVADHFALRHWEPECKAIKSDLLEYESLNTGRIRLADFYRAGLTSKFFYVETKDYLRAIGCLDDTDPILGPKVIIPNYLAAESNCLADTNIYSVCCMDECEGLYKHLEKEIAAAEASPALIISLVSMLSSSTVQAPRNFSAALVTRLHEIATAHGGNVIVHSRLFAQWMHQAFPRECKYPHLAGTTAADMPPDEWEKKTGRISRVDFEGRATRSKVLLRHIEELDAMVVNNSTSPNAISVDTDLMWSSEDELLIEPHDDVSLLLELIRPWAFLGLFISFVAIAMFSRGRARKGRRAVDRGFAV